MNKSQRKQFRKERSDELKSLARILFNEGLIKDTKPLRDAADECLISSSDEEWSYDIYQLKFNPFNLKQNRVRHTKPKFVEDVYVDLYVHLRGLCLDDDERCDPFKELEVNLLITGSSKNAHDVTCAWHLDRQIEDIKKSVKGKANTKLADKDDISHFVHPVYHFQHGGKRVWHKSDADFGSQLLLEAPRLAHPPLDGILAIDFILANYYGDAWNSIKSNNALYKDLLINAQNRYWRPYALALTSNWYNQLNPVVPDPTEWAPRLLWPNMPV